MCQTEVGAKYKNAAPETATVVQRTDLCQFLSRDQYKNSRPKKKKAHPQKNQATITLGKRLFGHDVRPGDVYQEEDKSPQKVSAVLFMHWCEFAG
jgi:hypothetical protein